MMYTIGRKAAYDAGLASMPVLEKLGRGPLANGEIYGGGIVFTTVQEAEAYLRDQCLPEYAVYGLMTEPDNTYHDDEEDIWRLVANAQIVPRRFS